MNTRRLNPEQKRLKVRAMRGVTHPEEAVQNLHIRLRELWAKVERLPDPNSPHNFTFIADATGQYNVLYPPTTCFEEEIRTTITQSGFEIVPENDPSPLKPVSPRQPGLAA